MRADRLLAVLLLLQHREQVTAAEVAAELEISERTARRDLEALSTAGVPVYAQPGRGGGWRLAGGGRIDLSGLTADEARALFVMAGPQSRVTPEVRSALRKLLRALPEPLRPQAEAAARSVVIDPAHWGAAPPVPRPRPLAAVESALLEGECVRIAYSRRDGSTGEREVHPLGLAAKGRHWYLIADTDDGRRTFRVDRISTVERTGRPAVRPEGFELATAWDSIVERVEELRTTCVATGTATPAALPYLRMLFARRLTLTTPGPDGRYPFTLRGYGVRGLGAELAGFGALITVTDPPELVTLLGELGRELTALYPGGTAAGWPGPT